MTCMCERQHLLSCQSMLRRVGHGSFYVVDLCMCGLLDVDAKYFSLMHKRMQMYKLNTLIGTRLSFTIKKSK